MDTTKIPSCNDQNYLPAGNFNISQMNIPFIIHCTGKQDDLIYTKNDLTLRQWRKGLQWVAGIYCHHKHCTPLYHLYWF